MGDSVFADVPFTTIRYPVAGESNHDQNTRRPLFEHFEVPEPMYVYIRQLENEILFSTGVVKKLYKDRFTNVLNTQESNDT